MCLNCAYVLQVLWAEPLFVTFVFTFIQHPHIQHSHAPNNKHTDTFTQFNSYFFKLNNLLIYFCVNSEIFAMKQYTLFNLFFFLCLIITGFHVCHSICIKMKMEHQPLITLISTPAVCRLLISCQRCTLHSLSLLKPEN